MRFTLKSAMLTFVIVSLVLGVIVKQWEVSALSTKLQESEAMNNCREVYIRRDDTDFNVRWVRRDGTELQTNVRDGHLVKISIDKQQVILKNKPSDDCECNGDSVRTRDSEVVKPKEQRDEN